MSFFTDFVRKLEYTISSTSVGNQVLALGVMEADTSSPPSPLGTTCVNNPNSARTAELPGCWKNCWIIHREGMRDSSILPSCSVSSKKELILFMLGVSEKSSTKKSSTSQTFFFKKFELSNYFLFEILAVELSSF